MECPNMTHCLLISRPSGRIVTLLSPVTQTLKMTMLFTEVTSFTKSWALKLWVKFTTMSTRALLGCLTTASLSTWISTWKLEPHLSLGWLGLVPGSVKLHSINWSFKFTKFFWDHSRNHFCHIRIYCQDQCFGFSTNFHHCWVKCHGVVNSALHKPMCTQKFCLAIWNAIMNYYF